MMLRFVASVVLLAMPAWASDPVSRCCTDRLRAAGSRERQLLGCHARAAARGAAVDPSCVAAVDDALERLFDRTEQANACAGSGEAAQVEADMTRIVNAVVAALRPTSTRSACTARKLKATGRLVQSTLRTFAKFPPYPLDHLDELDTASSALLLQFERTFARLEAGGDCLTTGDYGTAYSLALAGQFGSPSTPDGVTLTSMRVCPRCGDGASGGAEQCDGLDRFACGLANPCRADCTCPVCGDGVKNQVSEVCDGADAAACPGLCQSDCTCPTPVCGNGVVETGEDCDGAQLGVCSATGCQPDCTCVPGVCGNGIVEPGEQCDGPTCTIQGLGNVGCSAGCQCCDGGVCGILGCCYPGDVCLYGPSGFGPCVATTCRPDHTCSFGYTCLPSPFPGGPDYCYADVGSACAYFIANFYAPCVPPAVCSSSSVGVCCLPPGESCTSGGSCCSNTCNAGTCS